MSATPTPSPMFRVTDPDTGAAIVGAKVYTYAAGTSSPADTWADADKIGDNANPVIMDADGQAPIFIDGLYKFVVTRADDTLLYEIDDVVGGTSVFDRPASGVTSLPFDDIISTNVQDALEEIAAKRIKTTDTQLIRQLLDALGLLSQPGDIKFFPSTSAPTGWLRCTGLTVSRATYPNLFAAYVTNQGFSAKTFTVTIASPGVFTKAGHGFTAGERIRLTTTGALPTGLATLTDYWVKYIDANTFNLSATFGGASINTSGSQSGTHSYEQSLFGLGDGAIGTGTTFTLPNEAELFFRGIKPGISLAAMRGETIGPHTHTGTTGDDTPDHTHGVNTALSGSGGSLINGGATTTGAGRATLGAQNTHHHPFTTDANSGVENVPKHMALPLYCKV